MQYASFEQFLTVSRGLQPITIIGYKGSVSRMKKVLCQKPTHEQLNQYIQTLYTSDYSYTHKTNTALGIERWTEYMGYPIKFGRQKKPRPMVKETLTEGEITKIIFSCKNSRETAIIALLAYSALRPSELCRLKVQDIDFGSGMVRVLRGKGFKDGVCNISSTCVKLLLKYLVEFPRNEGDLLFTTLRKNNPYRAQDLRKLIHVVSLRAGFTKRIWPYLFRHSLAVNILNRGADVFLVKTQLRHSLIDTTMHYLNSLNYAGKSTYDKFAPSYN